MKALVAHWRSAVCAGGRRRGFGRETSENDKKDDAFIDVNAGCTDD